MRGPDVLAGVREREGDLLHRGRARLGHVVAGDGDGVPAGQFLAAVGEAVRDQAQRRARRVDVGAARDVLLEHVVLDRPGQRARAGALLLPHHLVEHEQHRGGRVDRHRGGHLAERYAVEQPAHVVDRVDRDPHLADLAVRDRGVGVVSHLRRQVEGDRQAGRPGLDQLLEAPVGLRGAGESGVLPHRPGTFGVHRRIHAAGKWIRSRLAQLLSGKEICKLSLVVDGFDRQSGFRHALHKHRLRLRPAFSAGGVVASGAGRRGVRAPPAGNRRVSAGASWAGKQEKLGEREGRLVTERIRSTLFRGGALVAACCLAGTAALCAPAQAQQASPREGRSGTPAQAGTPPQASTPARRAPNHPSSRRRPRRCCSRRARAASRPAPPRWAARNWPAAEWS